VWGEYEERGKRKRKKEKSYSPYYQRCRSDGVRNEGGGNMRKIWYYMGNGSVGLMRVMGWGMGCFRIVLWGALGCFRIILRGASE
jgi:hypothetical protein